MINTTGAQDVFISNARVIDPSSPYNGKRLDILIQKGVISKVGKDLKEPFGVVTISGKDLHVSPGFADLHVNIQDPGFEYKEDINSALNAAAAGGFTGILSCSTTNPCIDNKSGVEYQLRKAKGHVTDLWASGSVSQKQEGKELAEMFDMHRAGAKAFYDFKSEIVDSQLLKLALQYVKPFNGVIMIFPSEHHLTSGGLMNEGDISTINGLRGIPSMAEEIGVQRALKLAEYTDQRIHLTSVSTLEGLDLVKRAKKKGIKVTCGISVANLLFNDGELEGFDSNFKLIPPLREEKTRKALIEGLKSGVIDVVISDHWPQNIEGKECEFEVADFGMNTIDSSFAMLRTATKDKIEIEDLVTILSQKSRSILKMKMPSIKEKETANLTVFQPNEKWTFDVEQSLSQSKNSSVNQELTGRILAVVNNQSVHVNQ